MLEIFSPAFSDGGPIPRAHTCDGANLSPPFAWRGAPAGTEAFALIMDDPDAPDRARVHWVLYNMQPGTNRLPSGVPTDAELTRPVRAAQGSNDFARVGYGGPCPPPGPAHRYRVTLYALETMLSLPPAPTAFVFLAAATDHILEQVDFAGTYARA